MCPGSSSISCVMIVTSSGTLTPAVIENPSGV